MYTVLWLYLFLTALAVAGGAMLFPGDILSVWAVTGRKIFPPAAAAWALFFHFYFAPRWSFRTAEPLAQGEAPPAGRKRLLLSLAGGAAFGLAAAGLLTGPALIYNNFSAKSVLVQVTGTVADKGRAGADGYYVVLKDADGRRLRKSVSKETHDSLREGGQFTAEFTRGALGFYYP